MDVSNDSKKEFLSKSENNNDLDSDKNDCKVTSFIKGNLYGMAPKWKNCFIRGISCTSMNICVIIITYYGTISIILMVWLITFKVVNEILNLNPALKTDNDDLKKTLNRLSIMFVVLFFYIFFGNTIIQYFRAPLSENYVMGFLVLNHSLISVMLYVMAIGYFLSVLQPKYYQEFYSHLGWIHCASVYFFTGSLQVNLTFQGVIWTYFPVMLIVSNDVFAYLIGFFVGHTPLVKLSPKKTWEGYLGAMLPTISVGLILSQILVKYDHFVCPMEYHDGILASFKCNRNPVFDSVKYNLTAIMPNHSLVWKSVTIFPTFMFHGLILSIFAAVIAPVTGGFLASGLKRAFNVKDFDNLIPGHGGLLDRIDCQAAMSLFTWGYYYSLIQ